MTLNPHYFGAYVFGFPRALVEGYSSNTVCDYCALSLPTGTQTRLFSDWSCREPTTASSQTVTVCAFCAQAMRLDANRVQDGIIYLLPELDQAALIHLTIMAYAILSDATRTPASNSNVGSKTDRNLGRHSAKTYCVKAAQAFLSAVNRVGVARWQQVQVAGWQPEYLLELILQLRALPAAEWRAQARQSVAQTMRYVPIRSAHNMSQIEPIAQCYWARSSQFEHWFKRLQRFTERLQQVEQTNAKN